MINILSVDIDWIMEPSIQIYNHLIKEDIKTEQYDLTVNAPGAILNPDLQKFYQLNKILFSKNCKVAPKDLVINPTHKAIVKAINDWHITESFSIWNIDHHHDCGYPDKEGDERYYHAVTCGNWVAYIAMNNPLFKKYTWISNANSLTALDPLVRDKIPSMIDNMNINSIQDIKFDKIFICKSPGWIPEPVQPLVDTLCTTFAAFINL